MVRRRVALYVIWHLKPNKARADPTGLHTETLCFDFFQAPNPIYIFTDTLNIVSIMKL